MKPAAARLLALAPLLLLAGLGALFAVLSPRFLTAGNLLNILVQSAPVAIASVGMTFVMLTAGIDLSVGSVMFLGAAVCGKLVTGGWGLEAGVAALLLVGLGCGLGHGLLVSRTGVSPFVLTLATLFLLRGLGLWVSQTRAMNLPDRLRELATERLAGVPLPVLALAAVLAAFHVVLTRTPFGRQVLAVGHDPEAARKAGVRVGAVLTGVYLISGGCAALGGLIALAQLSAVSPTFGRERELDAVAAAVLGGTSLFGGRGNVFPGALLGAVLVQTVYNGLNLVNANPYVYPVITGGIIFLAVLLDSLRLRLAGRRPRLRVGAAGAPSAQPGGGPA